MITPEQRRRMNPQKRALSRERQRLARRSPEGREKAKQYAEARKKSPAGKEAARRNTLGRHGLTLERYEFMLAKQNGVCAICQQAATGKRQVLFIDHCHSSGLIRGLLCSHCNSGLGHFRDSVASLMRAIAYIQRGNTNG